MELYISKNNVSSHGRVERYYNVSMSTVRRDISELVQPEEFLQSVRRRYGRKSGASGEFQSGRAMDGGLRET
jgi:DeoR/GlpR family transcriptional regulator of sugar metabolism